jgi:DNA-binding PadR family transcriptional regulator
VLPVGKRSDSHRSDNVRDLLPLPRATFHVLLALQEGDLHGYAVKKRVEVLSGGAVRMAPGTLYETLHRMRERGLVEVTDERPPPEDDQARRSYYRMTQWGREALLAEVERLGAMIDHARALLARGET